MVIPDTFATHNADKQWGTVDVEKPVLELPYTTKSNSNPEKIKIFGVVEEPRAATWVYMTLTEPSGKTSQQKVVTTSVGYYENFILICCNKIGTYSVYVEWRGYHIGTVTFDVIQKSTTQNPTVSTATSKTSTLLTLNPLPSTFEIKDQNSPGVGITFSGKLTTYDRQYVITNAKIQLQDIRSGQTVQVTTDDNGKFSIKLNRAAGSNYAVNAVFDGSLNFESSKSQTEYFDVRQSSFPPQSPPQVSPPQVSPPQVSPPQVSPPTEDPGDPGGGVLLLVIIMVVVIVAIAIKKRKKRIPITIQTSSSGRGFEEGPESTIVFPKKNKKPENKRAFDYLHQDNNKKTTEEIANSDYDGTAVYTVMNQIQALLESDRYDDAVKRAIRYFTKTGYDPYYPSSLEVAKVFKHAKFEMKAERKLSVEEVDKILREDYELERGGRFIEKESKEKEKKRIEEIKKALETIEPYREKPKTPRTRSQWGWYWVDKARSFGLDDLEETLKCYENAIDVRLDYHLIYEDKARLFHYLEIYDLAIENYKMALSLRQSQTGLDIESPELELAEKHMQTLKVYPWDSNYLEKHGTLPSALFLKEKKLELEKLISKDGTKTKKKRSHVNKSSGTVVTNPRLKSKRDRLSREAKSRARWDEKAKQKRVNKIKDRLEQLRAELKQDKPKTAGRFECKCGYHTCKKFYKTEKERKLHLAGVLAQNTKKSSVKKTKNKKVLAASSVSRVERKEVIPHGSKATEAEKQWFKDHEMTDSELKQYIKDTKDTQKYDDDGNLRSEAKKPPRREIKQDVNKLLEKEPEIIQTISREMVTEYLNYKRTIDKSRKIKLIDEYLIHKSVAKVIELHSATGSTRREGEIKRHLITGLRLPAELRKLEEEGGLHPNHECSIKIALFATDHFNWDGQKNKEKDVVNLALAISEYLQSDLELNQIFQEEKRSEEVITRSKKRDEIHEKYEVEYSSSWQRVDRTLPQYLKLHGSKNLEVVEFLCKWEFKHKNRLPFRIADALLDNPEEALEKYKDELL